MIFKEMVSVILEDLDSLFIPIDQLKFKVEPHSSHLYGKHLLVVREQNTGMNLVILEIEENGDDKDSYSIYITDTPDEYEFKGKKEFTLEELMEPNSKIIKSALKALYPDGYSIKNIEIK